MKYLYKFDLTDRVALVTGAAGHLGHSMAFALAEAGAHVLLNGRSKAKLELLADEIRSTGLKVSAVAGDICDDNFLQDMIKKCEENFGRLDIIVNNAYAGNAGNMDNSSLEEFRKAYEVNVMAAFRIIQLAMPLLKVAGQQNAGGASVINIASMYGTVSPDPRIYGNSGQNNPPFYGAAKGALIQLTRYAACNLAPHKIRVNAISPGPFPAGNLKESNPAFYQELCNKNPMNRIGQPDELAGAILFLASDVASFVTGINLPVDGGWTAW